MPRASKKAKTDLAEYKRRMAVLHNLVYHARREISRVEGILDGAKHEPNQDGIEHRLKCLRGHTRALHDAAEAVVAARASILKAYSDYIP